MPAPITITDNDDNEITLYTVNELCGRCAGDGTHDAWQGGMTITEIAEYGDEFAEDYRRGLYAVPCTECKGRGVVAVPDPEQNSPEAMALWLGEQAAMYEDAAIRAAEQRAGC